MHFLPNPMLQLFLIRQRFLAQNLTSVWTTLKEDHSKINLPSLGTYYLEDSQDLPMISYNSILEGSFAAAHLGGLVQNI